jgi:NADPH:quinone reductase-like Zn-dependent oxidoreductase
VLVHGAGGVTGGLAVQLARAREATVVATAGPTSSERVRGYGAQLVFDYHDPDWPVRVRDASPGRRGVAPGVNAARGLRMPPRRSKAPSPVTLRAQLFSQSSRG